MRFTFKVACAVLFSVVASPSFLLAQWPEENEQGMAAGGYAGPALGPYGGVHVHEARSGAAPFGAVTTSSQKRVMYGPGGAYYVTTNQKVTRVGPEGTSTKEARRVAYGAAGGVHIAGTNYYRETSPDGGSYTFIDRTGLTGDPYADVHAAKDPRAAAAPFGAAAVVQKRVAVGPGGYYAATVKGVTGPGGTTVQASRLTVGTAGGVRTHSAAYFQATSPGDASYTHVERSSLTAGPYGAVHAHEVHSTVAAPFGATAGFRAAVAVAPNGGAGGVAVGHATRYVSVTALRTQGVYVREAYSGGAFTADWYRLHRAAWQPARWRAASFWVAPPWSVVARFCAVSTTPVSYNYGSTAVIDSGQVYLDGTQVASAADYADQALAVAGGGRQAQLAEEEEWQPLGVFGLIRGEEQEPQAVLQLAVNRDGILRGNYHDALTDSNLPVYGAVDRRTQRAAWSVGDKKTVVLEAGLQNLTQDETTVLVHYGTARTRQMALVRLQQPREEER
jgi:hypothetical protein